MKKDEFVSSLYTIVEEVRDKTEEKELRLTISKIYDEVDTEQTGDLGFQKRVELMEKLKEKLHLAGSAFDLSTQLLKEGDTNGNLLIDRNEVITWAVEKRLEVLGRLPNKYVPKDETEEELIARISAIFDKCDIDKSGSLRGAERVDVVKELQAELDLDKNPWAAQTQLRVEADVGGDLLVNKQELTAWFLKKKREMKEKGQ